MEPIVSGTTGGRIVRTLLVTVMFGGYAAWSLFDGYIAYPRANVEAVLVAKLSLPEPRPTIEPRADITSRLAAEVQVDSKWAGVAQRLGPPSIEHEGRAYYMGAGGYLSVELRGGTIRAAQWTDGPVHTPASIGFQKLIGFVLLPVTLIMIIQLFRVLRTRAVLSAESLTVGRGGAIPLTSIRSISLSAPGRFDLRIDAEGQSRTVCLDDYIIAKAPEIVRAICIHCRLDDPTE